MSPDVLTVAEVAERLRVSTTHVKDRIAAGAIPTLPASVVGPRRKLIPAAWLEQLIAAAAASAIPNGSSSEADRAARAVHTLRSTSAKSSPAPDSALRSVDVPAAATCRAGEDLGAAGRATDGEVRLRARPHHPHNHNSPARRPTPPDGTAPTTPAA